MPDAKQIFSSSDVERLAYSCAPTTGPKLDVRCRLRSSCNWCVRLPSGPESQRGSTFSFRQGCSSRAFPSYMRLFCPACAKSKLLNLYLQTLPRANSLWLFRSERSGQPRLGATGQFTKRRLEPPTWSPRSSFKPHSMQLQVVKLRKCRCNCRKVGIAWIGRCGCQIADCCNSLTKRSALEASDDDETNTNSVTTIVFNLIFLYVLRFFLMLVN